MIVTKDSNLCQRFEESSRKLKSSMTLFACADPENAVFEKVLEKFYNGHKDGRTLKMLSKENG